MRICRVIYGAEGRDDESKGLQLDLYSCRMKREFVGSTGHLWGKSLQIERYGKQSDFTKILWAESSRNCNENIVKCVISKLIYLHILSRNVKKM